MAVATGTVPARVLRESSRSRETGGTGPDFGRGRAGDALRVRAAARATASGWSSQEHTLLQTWQQLAAFGRRDLVYARLVEGHLDAVGILAEAGRRPIDDAVYGVWASGSQGTGLQAEPTGAGYRVSGLLRYCTGADWVDRVLVTARTVHGAALLFDLPVTPQQWTIRPGTWLAVGMDLSDSVDVEVDVEVTAQDQVGPGGFYLDRPGFALGGIGVAAVWLGGAAGVLDAVSSGLHRFEPDPHQLAHLGAMRVAVEQADALLSRAAQEAGDLAPEALAATALTCRAGVDSCVQEVLNRAPRLTGPTPLCRDGDFAHRLADLAVYVRQQHAERDLAAIGRHQLSQVDV